MTKGKSKSKYRISDNLGREIKDYVLDAEFAPFDTPGLKERRERISSELYSQAGIDGQTIFIEYLLNFDKFRERNDELSESRSKLIELANKK